MSRTFADRVAVITGASSGIGWALGRALAAEGCKVGLIARRQDKLTALAEEIQRAGGKAATASADVGQRDQGLPAESGYCASKAAVNTYMEGLRIQLRSRGIAVTTICPGFVKTPMTEINEFHMPFLMDADEAARRMVRALRRRKKVFDFPWQMKVLTKWLLPVLPDWVVARGMADYVEKPPLAPTPPVP
jgi:short-subunit dehydrogenase